MIVVDVPWLDDDGHIRAAAIGTCRLLRPLEALVGQGDLSLVAKGLRWCHTVGEALQVLEIVTGDISVVPDHVLTYILARRGRFPVPAQLRKAWLEGIDVFVVEVSTSRQFFYQDAPLQEALVSSELVRPHGAALLGWFRMVCQRGAATEDCVQHALDSLDEGGAERDETADLLRRIRLERLGVDQITETLRTMMASMGGRWIVVGPPIVADDQSALMSDRRRLFSDLREAARRCGATAYDPSRLIARYGRSAVLAGQGRHVYHYAEGFMPAVGEALASLIRGAGHGGFTG